MYQSGDTIYALASGLGTAGVAVIRLSGPKVLDVLEKLCNLKNPKPNTAYFHAIKSGKKTLDKGLILYFKSPHSFTGEDVAELQVHGGRGVIQAIMHALSEIKGLRPAVVALIAAPVFGMAKTARISWRNVWIPILSALLIWLLGVSPVLVILVAVAAGFVYGRLLSRKEGNQ